MKYLKALQKYCNEVLKNEGGVGGERPYATTAKKYVFVSGRHPLLMMYLEQLYPNLTTDPGLHHLKYDLEKVFSTGVGEILFPIILVCGK